jgi:deoxyribonuclease (pyrimidine dimer)
LVDPALLVRQHLHAEYRELPRIFALVRDAQARGEDPTTVRVATTELYTLGKGHCRFFYPRLAWLTERYLLLVAEMQRRGYQPSFTAPPDWTKAIAPGWYGQWQPTPACVALNVARINVRLVGMGMADQQIRLP